jgi:hypothetical protein
VVAGRREMWKFNDVALAALSAALELVGQVDQHRG